MNCLVPLITQTASSPSPSSTAVVSVPAASEPAFASVSPKPGERAPGEQVGEPALLLLLGAVPVDRHDAEPDPGLERDGDALVDARERLDGEAEVGVAAALARRLLRERQPEEPHLAHLGDDLHRQAPLGVVLVRGRRDDGVGEVAHRFSRGRAVPGSGRSSCGLLPLPCGCVCGVDAAVRALWASITATTWSRRTRSPTRTLTRTIPATGAVRGLSIFMASTVTIVSPAST